MLYCVMANCSSTNNRRSTGFNPYVEFFSFPKTQNIREKWIEKCCQKYRIDASSSKICSKHFRPTDFLDKTRLREEAVPTENLPQDNINYVENPTMRENVDSSTIEKEEYIYLQEEMEEKPSTSIDLLKKECIETKVDIEIKREPENDIGIGLEMEVEEENEPINAVDMIKHHELFIVTQSVPIITQYPFEEDDDPLQANKQIVRESPSFKTPIAVRDIRTLTNCNNIPTKKSVTVPLGLKKVPRSEALLAVLKQSSSLASQIKIRQYPVKKTPLKIVKPTSTKDVLKNNLLQAEHLKQNIEDSGGNDPNQKRKGVRVLSVKQVNRENGNSLPLITLPSTSDVQELSQIKEVADLNKTGIQSKHRPNIISKAAQSIAMGKKNEKMRIVNRVKKSKPTLICVLCSLYISSTCNIEPLAQIIKEMIGVDITHLTIPLRACRQCVRDLNVAVRLRNRVRKTYKQLIKNKGTCSEKVIDDTIPVQIPPEKVLRTYGKFNNLKKNGEIKSIENKNSKSYSQRKFPPYEQQEKGYHSNSSSELISCRNSVESEIIDVDLINENDNKQKQIARKKMESPTRIIKPFVNKEFQTEQGKDNEIVEIRESQLKNSHMMKLNKPSLSEIIDSDKEDSDNDLSINRKPKICFCMSNIPRDVFQLEDTQLKREFAKVKYLTSRCLRCFQRFPTAKRLQKHVRRRCSLYASGPQRYFVDGIETRTCDQCHCVFRSHIDVLIHKDGVHNSNNCSDCLMRFKDSIQATKHKDIHKTDDVTECLYCARLVSTRGYRVHRIAHGWDWWTWRRRRCNKCNGEVIKKEIYICTLCKMKFKTPKTLKNHSCTHKKKDPDLICKVCGKVFLAKPSLQQHLYTHTEDQKINRNVQDEGIQCNAKPYKCEICNASFLRLATKKRHMNEVHIAKQIKIMQGISEEMVQKFVKCEICNIVFINNKVKSRHMTIRHGKNIIKEEKVDVENVIK